MIQISPSLLASDFSNLEREACLMHKAGADMLHLDVMDGCFVPNLTIGPCVLSSLRKKTKLPFDVHLMIRDPLSFIGPFVQAGADLITFHCEALSDIEKTIDEIHFYGKKAGLSLRPSTPCEAVLPYLKKLDMVLVMTVEPGFGGQGFLPDTMPKLKTIAKAARESGRDLLLQVDGGIDVHTAPIAAENGANVLVAGSSLFSQPDYTAAVRELRQVAETRAARW